MKLTKHFSGLLFVVLATSPAWADTPLERHKGASFRFFDIDELEQVSKLAAEVWGLRILLGYIRIAHTWIKSLNLPNQLMKDAGFSEVSVELEGQGCLIVRCSK